MSCNVDRGYKNVDIGYILIMQLSPFSNDYANNWPQKTILHLVQLPTITEVIIIIVLLIELQ
jgi:hypothetical protein